MKKIILGILILPLAVQAQTIQGSAYPEIGTVKTLFIADTNGVNPGNGGDGVTWDFTTLSNTGQLQTDTFLAPNNTPYGASFPTATIVDHQQYPGTDYCIYYNNNGSELQRVGNVNPDTVVYYNPANQFPYPISFGSTNTDSYFASYNTNGNLAHMRGNFTNTVDGRGTLKLPTGNYSNVIRMKFVRNELDTIFAASQITGNLTETIYYWYQASSYYPLLSITILKVSINGFPPIKTKVVGYREGTTGIENYANFLSSVSTYPNPANENITIDYLLNQSQHVSFTLFNLSGEIVKHTADILQNQGNYSLKIDMEGIPNGMYMLKSNFGTMQKIIVNHG